MVEAPLAEAWRDPWAMLVAREAINKYIFTWLHKGHTGHDTHHSHSRSRSRCRWLVLVVWDAR